MNPKLGQENREEKFWEYLIVTQDGQFKNDEHIIGEQDGFVCLDVSIRVLLARDSEHDFISSDNQMLREMMFYLHQANTAKIYDKKPSFW